MNFPATLQFSIGADFLPFSDDVKYSILGVSVSLFLLAIGILGWQIHRYCTQTGPQGTGNGLLSGGNTATKTWFLGKEIPKPDFKVMSLSLLFVTSLSYTLSGLSVAKAFAQQVGQMQDEAQRLSRCLSDGSLLSNQSNGEVDSLAEDSGEEDRIRGSLRFSLFYDQINSRLVVTVLGAQGLPTRDFSHTVDPFVRVRLLWGALGEEDGEGPVDPAVCCVLHEWQSHLVKGCSSPIFGDEFSCTLAEDEVPRVTVRLEVRDFDRYSRHGVLGEVRAPLEKLNISHPLEILKDLQAPKKDQVGEALLSLKYLPISQRLEVGLLKIRALCREVNSDNALYARICVLCNQCKLPHQSTSLRTRWDVTIFNEAVTFTLPDQPVRKCAITVSVYEVPAGRKSSRRLVGQAALGKAWGSEDQHWHLMMRSLRHTIAKWHPLYI
ncbi:hypothetical protein GN956_G19889 [Arapaima gigas]